MVSGGAVLPTELRYLAEEDIKHNVQLSCQCKENAIQRKATFYFGVRSIKDLFLLDQMSEFEECLPNFKFAPCLSRAT